MRIVILSFFSFLLSVIFLLPNFTSQLSLPEGYYIYAPLALMVLAIVCQVDGVLVFRKILKAKQVYSENDSLSLELKDATNKLHQQKKAVTEYKTKFASAEKELRRAQESSADLEKRLSSMSLKLKADLGKAQAENKKILAEKKRSEEGRDVHGEVNLLQFLNLLQEKGRFLDFVMDDISRYPDQQVGAAARLVHSGCQKVVCEHLEIAPVRGEQEGSPIELNETDSSHQYRLLGNVGEPPYKGTILHRGWKAQSVKLPELVTHEKSSLEHLKVLAPAQVELI